MASDKASKLRVATKATWASYSKAQRAARIKKMLAARGLKPKVKKPPTKTGLKIKKALKSHWAAMSSKDRAARVRRMLAGRGLKPRK